MLNDIQSECLTHLLNAAYVAPVGLTHIQPLDAYLCSVGAKTSFISSLNRGDVIEIQGGPASGKTHLLYHLLIDCIIPTNYHSTSLGGWGKSGVVFDMDRSFSIVRFNRLLLNRLTHFGASAAESIARRALERLRVFRPQSSLHLAVTLSHISQHYSAHLSDEEIGIVAIDSIGAHHWPDCFVIEQMRSSPGFRNPLEHVLMALESFRRAHGSVVALANWGLHSVKNSNPVLYRQHLHPFPAPFTHSLPPMRLQNSNTPPPINQDVILPLTCHITLHQDTAADLTASKTPDECKNEAMKGRICGRIRAPTSMSVGKFLLYISADGILTD